MEIFLKKKPTDYNPNCRSIVKGQDWSKTSSANAVLPLGTLNFSNCMDIVILLVKKLKINAAFLIINE